METTLSPLLPFFDAARARGEPLVLATLARTAGSTYRKSGAQLLVATSGEYAGLISGGCLEGDLREHARAVLATGHSRTISYDMRGPDDELWGLGAGCEGAMEIVLQRMGPAEDWQPFAGLQDLLQRGQCAIATLLVPPALPGVREQAPPRCWIWQLPKRAAPPSLLHDSGAGDAAQGDASQGAVAAARTQALALATGDFRTPIAQQTDSGTLLSLPYAPPPALLLLGAGPDAPPVAQLAHFMGWRLAVYDHRSSLMIASRFPAGTTLHCAAAEQLREHVDLAAFDAAVVMSHLLKADCAYLHALAAAPCGYVGLLGPAPRRDKLLAELTTAEAQSLRSQLHAPVGLDLGGRSPEAIALSIVAGVQAQLHSRRLTSTATG